MLPMGVHETCPNPLHMVKMLGQATWIQIWIYFISLWRLSSITKKREIESPSLILVNWWNLFGLTLYSKCGFEIGWSNPSEGARWHSWKEMATWNEVHGGGVDMWWWSSSGGWKRRKRKTKWAQGKGIIIGPFCFWWSRHYTECDHI